MPRITNTHNAPASLVAFANDKHYDSKGSTYTVTQLMDSPRVRILRGRFHAQITEDVYDVVFRLIGTSLHNIVERYGGSGAEERLFLDLTDQFPGSQRLVVSGAIDLQSYDNDGVVIGDYKMTSVASTRFLEKYEKQLNSYAFLARKAGGKKVSRLEVYAILKDWNFRNAMRDPSYPQSPGVTLPIDLWSDAKQEQYFMDRVRVHVDADNALSHDDGGETGLVACTPEEQWRSPDKWAVMSHARDKKSKTGRGRAFSLHNSGNEAIETRLEKVEASPKALPEDIYVEFRPGERTRCMAFCDVADWCKQNQKEGEQSEEDHDVFDG
jgi:hypothetical protein